MFLTICFTKYLSLCCFAFSKNRSFFAILRLLKAGQAFCRQATGLFYHDNNARFPFFWILSESLFANRQSSPKLSGFDFANVLELCLISH
jgi:hypothetical protein